jgi:hypothetical protein
MRNLGKVVQGAKVEGKPWRQQLYYFLRNYRATPHSTTNQPPATLIFGRPIKTKLPTHGGHTSSLDEPVRKADEAAKQKMKLYADKRRGAKPNDIEPGDVVLVKQDKTNKLTSPFEGKPYLVTQRKGSMISAKRGDKVITRNSSLFRKIQLEPETVTGNDPETEDDEPRDTASPPAASQNKAEVTPTGPGPEMKPIQSPAQPAPHTLSGRMQISSPRKTRSGRTVKRPTKLADYV